MDALIYVSLILPVLAAWFVPTAMVQRRRRRSDVRLLGYGLRRRSQVGRPTNQPTDGR
jgi:hypothetical protein